jgi:predicted RNA-binding protein with PUA-like domain
VGLTEVTKTAYPDPDPEKKGDWVQIDLKYKIGFKVSVPLADIKASAALKNLPMIKQSQLSCMELSAKEFETLMKMGGVWADFQKV